MKSGISVERDGKLEARGDAIKDYSRQLVEHGIYRVGEAARVLIASGYHIHQGQLTRKEAAGKKFLER